MKCLQNTWSIISTQRLGTNIIIASICSATSLTSCFQDSCPRGLCPKEQQREAFGDSQPLIDLLKKGQPNFHSDKWNSPLWKISKPCQNLQKVSQLKSLSKHMLRYQNENTSSLGKSILEVIILIDSEDIWRSWIVVRDRHILKPLVHPQLNQQGNCFSFLSRHPDHHTKKLALSPQWASCLINNIGTYRHRKIKRASGRSDVTQVQDLFFSSVECWTLSWS